VTVDVKSYITNLFSLLQMNLGLYGAEYDSDGRYVEAARGLDDSRLLDAAETLVTLQTSDLGTGSNNPLFGSALGHGLHEDRHAGGQGGQFQMMVGQGGRGEGHQGGHDHMVEGGGQGGGRGRGKRGPSKRGKKKGGEGRGVGGMEVMQQEDSIAEADNLQELVQPNLPVEPMLKVGPLSLRGSILDEVLSEKKAQLMDDPDIMEFMRQHGMKH
jgi:hypothetical protein